MAKKDKKNTIDPYLKEPYLERSLQHITEEFFHKMRELSLIKRISEAIVHAADHEKVCLEISQIILEEVHAEECSLLLVDDQTNTLVLKAVKKLEKSTVTLYEDNSNEIRKIDKGLAGAVFQSGKPIYIKNTAKDRRFSHDPLYNASMNSVLCLPLISGENTIGILTLYAPEPHAFPKEDLNLLQIVANQVANVLRNVQLVKNLKESYEQQEQVLDKLKKAEKQLSNYAKDLEGIVEKRTNELVQSEKLATVGQLVAGVAHELNNPLTIVVGYVELLLASEGIPNQYRSRLEQVHQATMRCSKIVDNLLNFSQKGKLERKTISINDIINDTFELFEYQLKVNNIKLKKRLQRDLPMTVGDPQQLQQVFLNLIKNSYDALEKQKDKKTLEVKTYTDDKSIVIEFSDTGSGISKKHQRKLFEPFFTTKTVGEGTGLGLSLSYGIIKEHNGDIFLDTSYTKGAKFVIHLPIIAEKVVKTGKKQSTYSIDSSTRVLIVDDEIDIITFQQDILKKFSCKSDFAYNGEQALDLVIKNDYDVIISDIRMPGKISGIEFYAAIQETKPGLEKRIIFVTGDTVSIKTREFLKKCDNFVLEKPFRVNDFLDTVNRCLKMQTIR